VTRVAITQLIGVYNADGGFLGEARYVVGHLLGLTSCSLCDITHSPIRRKPEWDVLVATLEIPLTVLHKNEVSPALQAWLVNQTLPLVVGVTNTTAFTVVLDAHDLERAKGSVTTFSELLGVALDNL
jgi:hypothetical protein